LAAVKQKALEKFKPQTKVRLVLRARMELIRPTANAQSVIEVRNFPSKTGIVLESTDLYELWNEIMGQILENISIFQMNGSGWTFHSIVSLDIHTVKYKPLRGGSWVPSPKFLADKKALINMRHRNDRKNAEDAQCFKWTVAKYLHPDIKDPQLITKKLEEQAKSLNFDGIKFPASLKAINKFEKTIPELL